MDRWAVCEVYEVEVWADRWAEGWVGGRWDGWAEDWVGGV